MKLAKSAKMFIAAIIGLSLIVLVLDPFELMSGGSGAQVPVSQLYRELDAGNVDRLLWQGEFIVVVLRDGTEARTRAFEVRSQAGADLVARAAKANADVHVMGPTASSRVLSVLSLLCFPLVVGLLIYFLVFRPMQQRR